jgi:phosphate-selective porin OprO and OprP
MFQGNAALTYYVQLSFANLDTEGDLRLPLRDAYVTWAPTRDFNVRLGQMKVPFSRQRLTSSSALQMVDRSIVASELNLDRDVGLQVFSRDLGGAGKVGYALGLFGGEGRNRLGRAAGFLYTARVEAWPLGAFDDAVEGDVARSTPLRVAVGGSLGYNQNTNRPRSTFGIPYTAGDFDYTHAGLDAIVKRAGWSVISELLYRRADRHVRAVVVNGVPTQMQSRSGWGAYVQGGRMLTGRLEVTARYSRLLPSMGTDATFVRSREIGAGVSYYISRHDLKVQADYFSVTDAASSRSAYQARAQFQLFF